MEIVAVGALFVLAAVAEIGGAYLVWQGIRENRGLIPVAVAYGGIFVAGSLLGSGVRWISSRSLRHRQP